MTPYRTQCTCVNVFIIHYGILKLFVLCLYCMCVAKLDREGLYESDSTYTSFKIWLSIAHNKMWKVMCFEGRMSYVAYDGSSLFYLKEPLQSRQETDD